VTPYNWNMRIRYGPRSHATSARFKCNLYYVHAYIASTGSRITSTYDGVEIRKTKATYFTAFHTASGVPSAWSSYCLIEFDGAVFGKYNIGACLQWSRDLATT